MTEDKNWPFKVWLKIAVCQLGITPQAFWEMSLMDWFSLTQTPTSQPMSKTDLIKLEDEYEQS